MKKAGTTYIEIGKIGSTYGVQGWLKIYTYTEFGINIFDYNPLFLKNRHGEWEAINVEDGRLHGKGIIAKFSGMDNPEDARLLTGKIIGIPRSKLPRLKKDEYYWSDLQGLTVVNKHGEELGKVIYLMETGSNDVLVVKGAKEHAIPYLPGRVVLNVDLETQKITVDWELI